MSQSISTKVKTPKGIILSTSNIYNTLKCFYVCDAIAVKVTQP